MSKESKKAKAKKEEQGQLICFLLVVALGCIYYSTGNFILSILSVFAGFIGTCFVLGCVMGVVEELRLQNPKPEKQTSQQALSLNRAQLAHGYGEALINEVLPEVALRLDIQLTPPAETPQMLSDRQKIDKITEQLGNLIAQLQQKDVNDVVIDDLKKKINTIEKQVSAMQKDTNRLRSKTTTYEEKITNLENKTDELEGAHQSMKQEIKYGSPILSNTREKMQGSPKLSSAIKYTKPPFLGENSKAELQSTPSIQQQST